MNPWDLDAGLPAYLLAEPNDEGVSYGNLSYNPRRKMWVIQGDPAVTQLAKRLFPATRGGKRGTAAFANHWRFIADMQWLMLRYPLTIAEKDRVRWQEGLAAAREQAARKEAYRAHPQPMRPPVLTFQGELMEFQQLGLSYLVYHDRALLADEMGLGKTVQALAALAVVERYPVLLVVPPHLMTNWQREIGRFLLTYDEDGEAVAPRIHVLRGLKPYVLPEADIYIVHYLLLRGWKKALPAYEFETVIFDEVQELRHAGTEKYSAASLLSDSAHRVWGLSGTPIYNRGGEIYQVMNILDFHCLGDWESFTREWCAGYGSDVLARPEELGEFLRREGMMLRRTKAEVLRELPPKRRVVQAVDADTVLYEAGMQPVYEKMRALMALGGGNASQAALLTEQIVSGERQATGLAKAPHVAAFVRALLEGGERVLLFAHHHSVFDVYARELKHQHPVMVTGRENTLQKDRAVQAFMQGDTSLCCISLRAASGLNLQKATCVVFGELDWSPAVHSQAEDRAHRMGQEDSLLCYYLVCNTGSDPDVQDALGLKISQFSGLMGQQPEAAEDRDLALQEAERHMNDILARLAQQVS